MNRRKEFHGKHHRSKEKSILSTLPQDQQSAVKENFSAQEVELDSTLDHIAIVKEDESYKVYNKCFFITAIIALFGMIDVAFNYKRQDTMAIIEKEAVRE
ncbi:MAG: hypothetical protein ACERKZ_06225 [Lachnotalea sp.]